MGGMQEVALTFYDSPPMDLISFLDFDFFS